MKINIVRIIIMILLLGTFVAIFHFSSQNGEESGNLSRKIAKFLVEKLSIENTKKTLKRTEAVIRKIAHFSIYTLLGFLLVSFISTYHLEENRRIIISFLIGSLYAISDEIHQNFVADRSCQITDVILDSMGVFLGILLLLFILKIYQKIKTKKSIKILQKV